MQTRHRTPTIFNLSMVDVLCCALGCVILLWLLNLREATEQTLQAETVGTQLEKSQGELQTARDELARWKKEAETASGQLATARTDLRAARDDVNRLNTQATAMQAQIDTSKREADAGAKRILTNEKQIADLSASLKDTQGERDKVKSRILDLDKEVVDLKTAKTAIDLRLAKKAEEYGDVEKKLTEASQRVISLQKLVREKEELANSMSKKADEQVDKLTDAETRVKKQQMLADLVPGLREEIKTARDKLTAAESLVQGRDKELTEARQALRVAEDRFAGIKLTGQRVIFLVDMSGSMVLEAYTKPAPQKWTEVCKTVGELMESLNGLRKYQVIIFSEEAKYLLGNDKQWLNYNGKISSENVVSKLKAVQPKGGTNLFAAMKAAFDFRNDGLDAVYLLSDGLPNIGEGLTALDVAKIDQINKTDQDRAEQVKGELLGNYLRDKLKKEWNPKALGKARVHINTVGFFYESPDLGAFLWAVAYENEGSFVGMSSFEK